MGISDQPSHQLWLMRSEFRENGALSNGSGLNGST